MKLLMTLLVRDECDIIRDNIEHHLAHGVDYIIATDNGSVDGTRDILADYARQGVLAVIDEPEQDYNQGKWVTRMAHMARDEFAADWILNNDADEFWMPPGGTLKNGLDADAADIQVCRRRNMVYAYDDEGPGPWHQRIVHRIAAPHRVEVLADPLRDPLSGPYFYQDILPKVMTRAAGLIAVLQGNHFATYEHGATQAPSETVIYHFPVRSAEQFRRKILQGGAAYASNATLPTKMGWHWRRWYRMIGEDRFDQVLADALPCAARLKQDEADATVIEDHTMQAYFAASA